MYSKKIKHQTAHLSVAYENSMGLRKSSVTFLVAPPKDGLATKYICTTLTSLFWGVDVIFETSNVVWELVNIYEYHLVLLKHIHILLTSLFLAKEVVFKPSNVVGTLWTSMNMTWVKT
jgi:hypothetical protein